MSIITTGINIVATGVGPAIGKIRNFGSALAQTERQVEQFAGRYDRAYRNMQKSSIGFSAALQRNWRNDYNAAMKSTRDQGKALKNLEREYDRTFRNIGNRYQSMVMGSVAVSMSGIGLQNAGQAILQPMKASLDVARDFETVMSQIQFYGHRTADEMESIQERIFKLGYDLPVTTSEIGNAVLSAQKLGYDNVDQAIKMAQEASKINFVSLGKLDGDESMKYISHILKTTGTAIEDVDTLTDKIVKTADVSAASPDSLWRTIQSSRTAFDSLNTDADTYLTLLGVMADRLQPRQAGMALNSFGRGINMAEKAAREDRGTRGKYYQELTAAMGGGLDSYGGDMIAYVSDVAEKSREIWGTGTERTGNLISIFGQSAMDLFYAVDKYSEQTGRSMVDMRDEIANADGHAQKLMDTLMNGSYGTEQRLKAVAEQFQILFGSAIRPMFNKILEGLTFVLQKINSFIQAHPKLAKVLGYGAGLAGLFLVATGTALMFVGGLLAVYASLVNIFVQMARNAKVLGMLGAGFNSAGDMLKFQLMKPFKAFGKYLLRFGGITTFMRLAWKNDFFRMRTTFETWRKDVSTGLSKAGVMFDMFQDKNRIGLNNMLYSNEMSGGLDNWVANVVTKGRMAYQGVKDIWKDGTFDEGNYMMYKDAGLLPLIEGIYNLKENVKSFWKGFEKGLKDGFELLKKFTQPLIDAWEWLSEKALELFQQFGFFEHVGKDMGDKFENWGNKLGYVVGAALAIKVALWAWTKPLKIIGSAFSLIWKLLKNISGINMLKSMGKMAMRGGMWMLPQGMRNRAGYAGNRMQQRRMTGAHSRIPNARPTVDPMTGRPNGQTTYVQPTTWWGRQQLKREQKRANGRYVPGKNGASATRKGRGLGRIGDLFLGQRYVADEKYDKRGRRYHSVKTREGGHMRTDAKGRTKGTYNRTGGLIGTLDRWGRKRPFSGDLSKPGPKTRVGRMMNLANMKNFGDAGMSYTDSVGQRGHRRRSIVAGAKGMWNRAKNPGAVAGGNTMMGHLYNNRGAINAGKGGGKAGGGLGGALKGGLKGMGKLGTGAGKGLLKGLGKVVTKGVPMLFKGALRAIPILGWAIMAWDIISIIWSNWDGIKSGAGKAWDWIKEKGGQVWNWVSTKAGEAWDWVKTKASEIWEGIRSWAAQKLASIGTAVSTFVGTAWDWIKTKASMVWDSITSWAAQKLAQIALGISNGLSTAWNWVKTTATNVWNGIVSWATTAITNIWTWLTTQATTAWNWVKTTADTVWNNIKTWATQQIDGIWSWLQSTASTAWTNIQTAASTTWTNIKSAAATALAGIFDPIKSAWDTARSYISNNPIVQTVKTVGSAIGGAWNRLRGSHRTGLWKVPGDNYAANLHAGEMVLTRKEAQIMRSLVGSDSNSISSFLLDKARGGEDTEGLSIASATTKKRQMPTLKVKAAPADRTGGETAQVSSGDTTINFQPGSVQIHATNASASEMKKGARQMFEEFKRMVELDNMKNYRPARPR